MKRFHMCWLLLFCVAALLSPRTSTPALAASNPIVIENQQPGSDQWQPELSGFGTADDTSGQIKGYASAVSINKGQSITFFVSVSPAQSYTIDVYRLGWYGGKGGRLMQQIGARSGVRQPTCPVNSNTGLIACNWSPSYTLTVPSTWTTGVYLVQLVNAQGYQNYITFTVRDDGRVADFAYQQPVATYQAYNNYPDDGVTGKSVYNAGSYGANTVAGTPRAVKVSFDRPYSKSGAGICLETWCKREIYLIRWLERMGYDLSYLTDLDVHADGARLRSFKGVLIADHSEYWSNPMYDAAERARDAGIDLGFFGANDVYWQVRFEPSASGTANRVLVCYKNATIDPIGDPSLETVLWRNAPVNRPEQRLIGVQYTTYNSSSNNTALVISNNAHWAFAGTSFQNGDTVPGIVGYEIDRSMSNYPLPVHKSYTIISHSPYIAYNGNTDHANAVLYQALSGAWVFGAGTMSWMWALERDGNINPNIQQMTVNILNTFLTGNLLFNGDIEADSNADGQADGWSSNARVSRSSAAVRSGSYALRHQASDNGSYSIFSDSVQPIVAGTAYQLGSWLNIPPTSDSFSFELQIRWRDASSNIISTVPAQTFTTATSGWTPVNATLVAPTGATQATIRMAVSSLNATIYVDDLALRPALLVNGGFEADSNADGTPDGWSASSRASRSNVAVFDGSYALRHQASDDASYTVFSDSVQPMVAGTTYPFSAAVNIPPTSDSFSFELQVRWRDASSNIISTVPIQSFSAATSGWTPVSAMLTAPPNATQGTIRMAVTSLNATVYVDNVLFGP